MSSSQVISRHLEYFEINRHTAGSACTPPRIFFVGASKSGNRRHVSVQILIAESLFTEKSLYAERNIIDEQGNTSSLQGNVKVLDQTD